MPRPASSASSFEFLDPATQTRSFGNRDHNGAGLGITVVPDVDDPDDASFASSSEAFSGVSLLADESLENVQESREEQTETCIAIRKVQRKIVRMADEAVAASSPSADGTETSSVSSAFSDTTTSVGTAATLESPPKTCSETTQPAVAEVSPGAIRFVDTLSNEFEIPYTVVRNWQVSITESVSDLFPR